MKKVSHIFILSLFFFLLWSSCSENDGPSNPVILTPTLTGFSPTSGTVGTTVTLTGTNFSTTVASNVVKFNGTTATVTAATATSLTVSVPAGAISGKITVQVDNQTATSNDAFTVSSSSGTGLALSSFSPTTGESGISVTILGTAFSATVANNVVKFNGTVAVVTAAGPTSLAVTVPDGATTGKITIEVSGQVATSVNDFIVITTEEYTVTTLTGNGALGFVNGSLADARFYQPTGVALDKDGNIYVADAGNHAIRKISSGGIVTTLAGNGVEGFVDGTGTAAQFASPRALTVDGAGNVFVADTYNHRIRKITPAGEVSTLAGTGVYGFADGAGAVAKFYLPNGIVLDASGNIYVADENNLRIRKITPAGVVSTFAGSVAGATDGNSTDARFLSPLGLAIDGSGNIYVADAGNHRIRMITPAGIVSTVAGSTEGITDAAGSSARFNNPAGVAVDASGTLYVADDDNERIRKITPGGTVSTMSGGFLAGFIDGIGTDAQFRSPTGIALDASGNLYIADRHNHAVRKITQ